MLSGHRDARARKLAARQARTGGVRPGVVPTHDRDALIGLWGIGPKAVVPEHKRRIPNWVRPSSLFPRRESE
jgi:hypothetical protein